MKHLLAFLLLILCHTKICSRVIAAEPDEVISIWPGNPPGPVRNLTGPERDVSRPNDRQVANKPVIRLSNVATAEAHVFRPPADKQNGAAVVVCPGGGFSILAWDLEGTEVAAWLNDIGITAIVLKYRVPTRQLTPKWLLPTQDAQRTLSIVRSKAANWNLKSDRIAIMGFSAGGHTAVRTAFAKERLYAPVDAADEFSCRPDASLLIYPGYLADSSEMALIDDLKVDQTVPPAFMVHAWDDRVSANGSMLLACAMKVAKVEAEVHVYDTGGHGYGLRRLPQLPVTTWPDRATDWFRRRGWLSQISQ